MTDLRAMFTRLSLFDNGSLLVELQVKPVWIEQIKSTQLEDVSLDLLFREIKNSNTVDFGRNSEGVLCSRGRICVPKDTNLRQTLLREAHNSPYVMHPGGNKMYRDLRELLKIPMWKWERVIMDFVNGLHLTPSKKDSVWVIVDQLTKTTHFIPVLIDYSLQKLAKLYVSEIYYVSSSEGWTVREGNSSCWTELGEQRVLGLELVSDTKDKISPSKKVLRFGHKGKLSPSFVGPYRILRRVEPVAYQSELPPELE
ncbi:uncharacterized protein LOC128283898 [Gossypium arboreum]|uniref:uncharacterized protein LOC128283898 n=1 Tax=Gossypium arboreum TaxID=29729 RepID=UPI0022F1A564|nr:uncharacterized protein LOC128283898 [Gossypium arboreum]